MKKDNTSTQDAKSTREHKVKLWWRQQVDKKGICRKYLVHLKDEMPYLQLEAIYEAEHPSTPPMEETKDLLSENVIGKPLEDYIKAHHTQEECIGFIDGYNALTKENELLKEEVERLRKDNKRLGESCDSVSALALEFGYKQCEKGENIQAAFINYNKIIQGK